MAGTVTPMRRVALVLLLVVAALLAASSAASGSGSGSWSKPATLVAVGTATYQPAVATAPNGTTVAVWDVVNDANGTFSLVAGIRSTSGKIEKHPLGKMTGIFPPSSLAVGGDGTFAAAWAAPGKTKSKKIFAAVAVGRPGKRGFGKTTFLSPGNLSTAPQTQGDTPQVAVDDVGTVYVVWEGMYGEKTRVVESQLGAHASGFTKPRFLSAASDSSHAARIAAHGNGNVAVSWTDAAGAVWGNIIRAGHIGRAKKISRATYPASPPSVAAGSGKAVVVWQQTGGASNQIASKITRGASFPSAAQNLSGKTLSRYQAVALAANGSGVAAWESSPHGGSGWQIRASTMSASADAWSGAKSLSRVGSAVFGWAPSVAAANGRAFVAWNEKVGGKYAAGVQVIVGGRLLSAHTFPTLGQPAVSANPSGGGRVLGALVWPALAGLEISVFGP